jgi:hypothetical protein
MSAPYDPTTNAGVSRIQHDVHLAKMGALDAAHNSRMAEINADRWKQFAEGLKKNIAVLEKKIIIKDGVIKGSDAMYDTIKTNHPDLPEFKPTKYRFKDGDTKTASTLIFERAFDAYLAQMKIENPSQYRAN